MNSYFHKVQYYETDRMGITHHSNYVRWMEEARVDLLDQVGWGYARMEENGIVSPVTELNCQYRNSTTFGDEVEIVAKITEFKGVRLEVSYRMQKQDGSVVCEARSSHCFLDRNGHFIRMKREFPELYQLLTALAEQSGAEE